jgi:hypothetical protein
MVMTGYPRLRRVARLAMPAACLLLVAGCGSENTNSGDSPQTSAPAGPVEATVVTVHRAGGIAGVNDSWTVRANSPGDLSPAAAAGGSSNRIFTRVQGDRTHQAHPCVL